MLDLIEFYYQGNQPEWDLVPMISTSNKLHVCEEPIRPPEPREEVKMEVVWYDVINKTAGRRDDFWA